MVVYMVVHVVVHMVQCFKDLPRAALSIFAALDTAGKEWVHMVVHNGGACGGGYGGAYGAMFQAFNYSSFFNLSSS